MSTSPDGLFQYGGQPVGALWASPWSKVYFVDGESGSTTNDGLTPGTALSTIQAAVTLATRGDIIYIRPQQYTVGTGFSRYTEEVTVSVGGGGTASHCTNADISIIGCVNTSNPEYGVRWKHATDTTGYCLINHAPALHVENIGFFAESSADAISLLSNGSTNTQRGIDGTTFYNCVVKGGDLKASDGGDGLSIKNCRFHCGYDGHVAAISYTASTNPGRRLLIDNCVFQTGNGTAASGPFINIGTYVTEVQIRNCFFPGTPTGNAYISSTGSNTGGISNCFFAVADVSTTAIVEGGLVACGIYDGGGLATAT